ncbi:hypothetical protein C8J57DRAFT_1536835 [Mycena rebaudengoi]|nr:hypothetical protein C8J57DRAFT_1536835 [Mycena rebaudengoi]
MAAARRYPTATASSQHTERAYKSACEPAAHYWLFGQDPPVTELKACGVKGKEKTVAKSSPLPKPVSASAGSKLPKHSYDKYAETWAGTCWLQTTPTLAIAISRTSAQWLA